MTTIDLGIGRLLAGAGGLLLIVSLFMDWAKGPGGVTESGWEFSTTTDIYLLIVALLGIAFAITGGAIGFFRPDVSLSGTADMLAVVATILLVWLIFFDFPDRADAEPGVYLALISSVAIMCGAGDFRINSLFPELPGRDRRGGR
jgi:hypothetical protein